MKNKIETGKLCYTIACDIVPIVDAENEKYWVDLPVGSSRRKVRTAVRDAARPTVRAQLVAENKKVPPGRQLLQS